MPPLPDFITAQRIIAGRVIKTPLLHSAVLSRMLGGEIYLKLENLQRTGSFKIRGALSKIGRCADVTTNDRVVAASAGNHAQGVALAAREAGIAATIVMPEWASISKQEATSAYGGKVVIHGSTIEESLAKAHQLAEKGGVFVHPFDDLEVIAGQGTIGLEILEQLPDPDLVVVPVGGGGLISGVAAAVKSIRPQTVVCGVQTAACPAFRAALEAGRPLSVPASLSIADGISVKRPGKLTYEMVHHWVDDVVLAEENQIAAAIVMLLEKKKMLTEGAGAAGLAAILGGGLSLPPGSKTVLVISGGNVDSPLLGRIINQGLSKDGRVMRLRVDLDDVPGSLARLLARIAALKANVLHIHHDRNVVDTPLYTTRVHLELETRDDVHIARIIQSLSESGYSVEHRRKPSPP
jgi:threonine dehydratase